MRLWIGAQSAFDSVVMMVQEWITPPIYSIAAPPILAPMFAAFNFLTAL
jgi:hypothetical protein